MSYLRLDNRRKRSNNGDIAKAIGLLIVLIVVFYIFSKPLTQAFRWTQSLIVETLMPSTTIVRSQDDAALIKTLQAENTQLQELLGRRSSSENSILAAVIVHPPKSPYDTLIIDAGAEQGITTNMVAYGADEFVIGRVTDVQKKTSVITLFSSSNQKESVLIGTTTTASSTTAIAEGRGGGNFYIKLPRNIEVSVGDPVIWPAAHLALLGVVEKVDADMGGTYEHIYFKSPVNIQSLRYVQLKEPLI